MLTLRLKMLMKMLTDFAPCLRFLTYILYPGLHAPVTYFGFRVLRMTAPPLASFLVPVLPSMVIRFPSLSMDSRIPVCSVFDLFPEKSNMRMSPGLNPDVTHWPAALYRLASTVQLPVL